MFVAPNQEVDITVYGDGIVQANVELYTLDGVYVASASADWYSSSATVFPYYQDVAQVYQLVINNYSVEPGEVQVVVTGY